MIVEGRLAGTVWGLASCIASEDRASIATRLLCAPTHRLPFSSKLGQNTAAEDAVAGALQGAALAISEERDGTVWVGVGSPGKQCSIQRGLRSTADDSNARRISRGPFNVVSIAAGLFRIISLRSRPPA